MTTGGGRFATYPDMKSSPALLAAVVAAVLSLAGCKPKPREITSLQRKQAAQLVSEAQFAVTLRDYAKAEDQLAQAVAVCPDDGDTWVSLGSVRVRLGQRDTAKAAYQKALGAFQAAAALDPKDDQARLRQVSALVLLGRVDEARALLAKLREQFPDNRTIRMFADQKQLDNLLADPAFKEISL